MSVHEAAIVAVALVACAFDLRSGRIPNVLTFGAACAALLFWSVASGPSAAGVSAGGWALATALWLPLYALGGMGAGDVKLIAAVGAWLGPAAVLWVTIYTAIAGGVMAAALVVARRSVPQTAHNIQLLLAHWRSAGFTPHATLTLETAASPRLAYAVPILAGIVAAVWLR